MLQLKNVYTIGDRFLFDAMGSISYNDSKAQSCCRRAAAEGEKQHEVSENTDEYVCQGAAPVYQRHFDGGAIDGKPVVLQFRENYLWAE